MPDHRVKREWTLEALGDELMQHTAEEIETRKMLTKLYEVVVVGNGVPPLKYQIQKHDEWIAGANKIIWMFIGVAVVQFVGGGCVFFGMLAYLLMQQGIWKP